MAFDTMDYIKLFSKLQNYGIRGNALELLKCYLLDGKQYVKVLNEESSKLEPLLFLLYINDIYSYSKDGLCVLFCRLGKAS